MSTLLSFAALIAVLTTPINMFAEASVLELGADVYLQQENQVTKLGLEERAILTTGDDSLLGGTSPSMFENIGWSKITAYSSTPDQTDDTPFIMASGKHVYDGAIATNFLPLGTKVRFPELFGDKVFTVEDRMNRRFQDRIDIWMETRTEALNFGMRSTTVEVAR